MADYSELLKFAPKSGGPTQAAPAAPSTAQGPSYSQLAAFAPSPPAVSPTQNDDPKLEPRDGTSPMSAIGDSPLSVMERGMLGWVRNPNDQEKYLKQHFDDVQRVAGDDGVHFAIKQADKWYQADPAFEWKFDKSGLNNAIGSFAQLTGRYGLRAEASMQAGEAGMAAGAEMGSAAGPLGALAGGVVGGLGMAALGGATAEGADLASRKALMDPTAPGATPYTADELNHQLISSALFGANAFPAGKAMSLGISGATNAFASSIKSIASSDTGQLAARKWLGMFGIDPMEAQARIMNPEQNSAYDQMRAWDNRHPNPIGMGRLDKAQEAATDDLHDEVNGLVAKQQGEFAQMMKDPRVNAAQFDLSSMSGDSKSSNLLFNEAKQQLQSSKLVLDNGAVNGSRILGEADNKAINFIMDSQPMLKGMDYMEARAKVADAQSLLKQGISNPNVERIMVQLKNGMNEAIAGQLEDTADGLGNKYSDIIKKYADVRNVQDALDSATSGQKRFALGNKLTSDNPNQARATMDGLVNAGVDPNSILKFVQMQGSRNADELFTNKRFIYNHLPGVGKFLPAPGPKVGVGAYNMVNQATSAIKDSLYSKGSSPVAQATLPYTENAVHMMKGMDPGQLKSLVSNPKAVDMLSGMVTGAAQQEQQIKGGLLNSVGANATNDLGTGR